MPPEEWATCFVLSVRREKGFESREGEKEESSESHSLTPLPQDSSVRFLLFVQAVVVSLHSQYLYLFLRLLCTRSLETVHEQEVVAY